MYQYLTVFARETGGASTFVTIDFVNTGTAVLTGVFNLGTLVDVQFTQFTFKTRSTCTFEATGSVLKYKLWFLIPNSEFQQSAATALRKSLLNNAFDPKG